MATPKLRVAGNIVGKSAYDIAVANGFEGSEEEWLASLKGVDGISATHSWNGTTLTITSASGTSSADLKGEKGDQGEGTILVPIKKLW